MNLRQHYLTEWRIWYNAFNKARQMGVEVYEPWLNFETWLDEFGPRQHPTDQFCRDNWELGWLPDNAGWRTMPAGRKREYQRGYLSRQGIFNKESNCPLQ